MECEVAPTVPICNNANNQELVDSWRAAGKKVILSFGGAGSEQLASYYLHFCFATSVSHSLSLNSDCEVGGSWAGKSLDKGTHCRSALKRSQFSSLIISRNTGDSNNCWDYCFDKTEELSTSLVNIIDNQHFDGIGKPAV